MDKVELRKMATSVDSAGNVSYLLRGVDSVIEMNKLLGSRIQLQFTGTIRCVSCGKTTKKSFGQGYCYRCFITSPETEECVLKPHLCQAHLGVARDMAYAHEHCLIEHYVYLAISGGLKVGVTRNTQIPTRWVDQGATQGLVVAKTPNRYLAGVLEVELMKHFSDKTNWRKMLTNADPNLSLEEEYVRVTQLVDGELSQYVTANGPARHLVYPVLEYPTKVSSLSFDKNPMVDGILMGIRGQYLIFDGGQVINLRTFTGYEVEVSI